jgi:hypothetical protein
MATIRPSQSASRKPFESRVAAIQPSNQNRAQMRCWIAPRHSQQMAEGDNLTYMSGR